MQPHMTIGEFARLAGVPSKTIRFYSDEGLLPPADRSDSGYRLYSVKDLVRLELIRTLRDAGVDLGTIRSVLGHEIELCEALTLRLAAIEAHITSLQHVAAAIRGALRAGPSPDNLRRLQTVTKLSNEERRAVIAKFYEQVAEGIPLDRTWVADMVEASAPQLPDEPTPAQLDAWIELSEILSDPEFLHTMREAVARTMPPEGFDRTGAQRAEDAVVDAMALMRDGVPPDSPEAQQIVQRFAEGYSAARRRVLDDSYRDQIRDEFMNHDPRAIRYWELVAIMNGTPVESKVELWVWLAKAIVHHL